MRIFVMSLAAVLASAAVAVPDEPQAKPESQAETGAMPNQVDAVFFGAPRPVFFRFHIELDGRPQPAAWREQIAESFRQFDRDASGGLSGAELVSIPWIRDARFSDLGQLLRNQGARKEIRDDDATEPELIELARQMSPVFRATPVMGGQGAGHLLFTYLDRDDDGRLTSDELDDRALSRLLTTDLNDDESSTIAELMQMAGLPSDGDGYGNVPSNRLERVRKASFRLLDITNMRDKQSMFFTREMLQLAAAAFDEADADGDEQLDVGELAAYLAKSTPDIELRVRLGERESSQPAIEVVPPADARDSTANAVGRASGASPVVEVEGCRFEFGVASADPRRNAERYEQLFAGADADNNEYLDAQEVRQNGFFQGSFKSMDADGDGKLFADEMKRWLERQLAAAATRAELNMTSQGQPLFQLFDTNSDGRLTARELKDRTAEIARYDHNQDGALAVNELPERFGMTFQQGQASLGGVLAFSTGNFVVQTESSAGAAEPAGPRWFRRMDRNRDGDVSRREFIGPLATFAELDADGDGLLDAAEAAALEKRSSGGESKP